MASWDDILNEVKKSGSTHDIIRRRYLRRLAKLTKRNVIVYYSGWLQKGDLIRMGVRGFEVNDADKNGFMTAINKLDRSKGLDLILHTPGGETAATESLVDYLRTMFGNNIRAIVPQIAMSGGTMIALACKEIIMGKHSNLGPIDPQYGGLAAHGVIEEFERAKNEIQATPLLAHVWQPILAKYTPTLIGECEKAIDWSKEMTKEWLVSGMFVGEADAGTKADRIISELGDHILTKSHARHISMQKAKELNIKIVELENDSILQDAVLSVHHSCIHTLTSTAAIKIIENHMGTAFIQTIILKQA
jgi:ATP-dependent protease ClpP protease subunit